MPSNVVVRPTLLVLVALFVGAEPASGPVAVFAAEHTRVRLSETDGGDIELRGPFGVRTSRRGDAGFEPKLEDAARDGRLAVMVRGRGTLEVGALSSKGSIAVSAPRVHVVGRVRARSARLTADDALLIDGAAELRAHDVELRGRVVMNLGSVSADDASGGRIVLAGDHVMNQGALLARGTRGDGGEVRIAFGSHYIESRRGSVDVSGSDDGGAIRLGGREGSYAFSSGRHRAHGRRGGRISLVGDEVALVGASLDASGIEGGGAILVGDKASPRNAIGATRISTRGECQLLADAEVSGAGGRIVLASLDRTRFGGRASARGGRLAGDGGFVEVSSAGGVAFGGAVATDAPNGHAGRLVLDPKNITISDADPELLRVDLVDPTPFVGDEFGKSVASFSSGNIVVTDGKDDFTASDAGAVHLFSGRDGALLATLTGSSASDGVGTYDTRALSSGNYVVQSPYWDNGGVADAGAATWGNGTTGIAGVVSATNSLVGTSAGDSVGGGGVIPLSNGNYVVRSSGWDNGGAANAGAVTWGSGATGVAGAVSAANSLVGTTLNDSVGSGLVRPLNNGNYVVASDEWDNGGVVDAGAATWGSGVSGVAGVVSATNSLVGTTAGDGVANSVTALQNGNYVVSSITWDDGAVADVGAATWGNGTTGITGAVSATNSLVGTTLEDRVGSPVWALTNGNYVVMAALWDNGGAVDAGAATWGNGAGGTVGAVSAASSLVGATTNDHVGSDGVTALSNGNYVVRSGGWDDGGTVDAGAVTWGNGTSGVAGAVSATNSLVGTTASDNIGNGGVMALSNGNYVVRSYTWDNGGAANAGAATWGNGTTGIVGAVSAANSLVGTTAGDGVGLDFRALSNGNYVVASRDWDGGVVDAGAVTWGSGATGIAGAVSAANSLVGTTAGDGVGNDNVTALQNGNYVVGSGNWDNGGSVDAGAVTWGNGATGIVGAVSAANSLIGANMNDMVGNYGVEPLSNGNYVVPIPDWDDGGTADVGATTWGNGAGGTVGVVSAANSLVGTMADDRVGEDGVYVLSTGDYVVASPYWHNGSIADAGALTLATGTSGTSGVVSTANSLVGSEMGADLHVIDGPLANTFVGLFRNTSDVSLVVTALDPVQPGYAFAPDRSLTIAPDTIASVLSDGTDVLLEASNDLTVDADIVANNASGPGGDLTLAAGRGIALNADISTDGGDLALVANDILASGVIDAERDPGAGGIAWDPAAAVNAGTGDLLLRVRDGAGKTEATPGTLEVGDVTAGTVLARAQGSALSLQGDVIASATGDAIVLVTDVSFVAEAAASLTAANGRFLAYAPSPDDTTPGPLSFSFEEYGKTYPEDPAPAHDGDGILYASAAPDSGTGGSGGTTGGAAGTGSADASVDSGEAGAGTAGSGGAAGEAAGGVGGSDGGIAEDAGADGGTRSDDGCGCSTPGGRPRAHGEVALTTALILLVLARRRR